MARRQSMAEDIMDITAKLPWWVGVSLAGVSFIILHWYAGQEVPKAEGVNAITQAAVSGLYRTLAMFGQYVLPALFLIGALVSALKGFKRKKLYEDTSTSSSVNVLDNMSWKEFELLIGEHFRKQGHKVVETAGGADGGVDLIVTKNGGNYLIQCKQWKAYKVGVKIVRELLGVMVDAGAAGGYVVTSGEFTKDAIAFARDNNIQLLGGKDLRKILKARPKHSGGLSSNIPGSISQSSSSGGIRNKGEKTMSEQKRSMSLRFKTLLALCAGIVVVVLITLYVRPIIIDLIHKNEVKERISEIQAKNPVKVEPSSKVKKAKEYSFNDAQINKAIREVEASRKNIISSSQTIESGRSLYEIEFLSGSKVYSENVIATADVITFENGKGLVVSVSRSEVKNLKRLVQKGGTNSVKYSCQGKTHCSEMSSCEEAKFYLLNCPGVKIDGDSNGVPCEKQWCSN